MDLRVKKTEGSIQQAFLDLRRQKPLEKITVKELCQRAEIHKSTFYSHYEDLYALSDALETQVVEQVIFGLRHPEYVFERPAQFTRELFQGYWTQDERIQILFSGSRSGRMVEKVEESVKQLVFRQHPEYARNPDMHIFLSYTVYGGYHAYIRSRDLPREQVVELISQLSERGKDLLDQRAGRSAPLAPEERG